MTQTMRKKNPTLRKRLQGQCTENQLSQQKSSLPLVTLRWHPALTFWHLAKGKASNASRKYQARQVSFATVTKDKHDAENTDQRNVQALAHSPDPATKAWPETMTNLVLPYFSCLLSQYPLHQPYTNEPCKKTIKAHACLATNPKALLKKLKMAPTTFPTIAGNASTAFSASLFWVHLLTCLTIYL